MKLSTLLIVLPVGVIAAILALANRAPVTFSINPFDPDDPLLSVTLPLFVFVFLAFFLGTLVGGATVGLKRRARMRRERAQAAAAREAEPPPQT